MILFTLILAFLSALVYADLSQYPNCDLASPVLSAKFNQFKSRHNRSYKDSKEEKSRSDRFKRRLCEIDYMNSINLEPGCAEFEVNHFSDWEDEEFNAIQGGRVETTSVQKRDIEAGVYDKPVPTTVTSINWCTDGYCSPIKDQQSCGSCWAYSTTAAYESAVAIKFNLKGSSVPVYSPQYILDCNNVTSIRPGSSSCWKGNGCNGGPISFGYIKEKGHFTSANYPASSDLNQHNCAKDNSISGDITLTNWVNAQTASEDQIAANLAAYGPIPALVYAGPAWQNYKSGSITLAQCGTGAVNHAVVIVGFTATDWIIRNSWGASWGESGFVRIARGVGACQISQYAYLVPSTFIPDGPTPATTTPTTTPKPTTTPTTTPKPTTTPSTTPKPTTTPSTTPKPTTTPSTTPKPTTTPSTPTTCPDKSYGCLPWPQTIGQVTMTCCSNLPVYGVSNSATGVCFTNITTTSQGTSFVYKNCPTTCGTNPPTFAASSAYGGNKNNNEKIVAIPYDKTNVLAINSETGASFTPSDSPLPVYIGAGVIALVALVVIVVIVVLVKRRANQEEIV